MPKDVPIQAVEEPILCTPYGEPTDGWAFDRESGEVARHGHTL